MERFDEHFVSVDKQSLLRIMDQNNRDSQWPIHSKKLVIPYSIMDEQLYEGKDDSQILDFEEEALRIMHGDQNILFMTSTIRRQAASCIFGLAPCVRAIIDRRFNQLDGEDFKGALSVAVNKLPAALLDKAKKLIRIADDIPEDDPKLDSLMDIVHEVNARDHNKIILFSSFRHRMRPMNAHGNQESGRRAAARGNGK